MSSRHTRSFFGVMLAVVFAFSAVIVAPASAKLTKHQKAHIRKQLKRAIHKNPRLIKSKRFIKKASLVDFVLPVTIKLRGVSTSNPVATATTAAANPNKATINLGASLGQREIDLGGTLPAQIRFHDSFDGGALGNVDLELDLGWRPHHDVHPAAVEFAGQRRCTYWYGGATPGCNDFTPSANLTNSFGTQGVPYFDSPAAAGGYALSLLPASVGGTAPNGPPGDTTLFHGGGVATGNNTVQSPGVDAISNIHAWKVPGDPNSPGGNINPFPESPTAPPSNGTPTPTTPSVTDTVLRTGPISLGIAAPGTVVPGSNADGNGPSGTQTQVIGKSGGQANLFGNIPGKNYGIDVTLSLQGQINSIIREVDADNPLLVAGGNWPGAAFQCRQAWTGNVQNYIPDVKLQGNLKIAPAITASGDLRIAKATLSSLDATQPARVALAACLFPYSTFAKELAPYNTIPTLPVDTTQLQGPPPSSVKCNDPATTVVANSLVSPLSTPAGQGFTTSSDGSQVSVAGDLTVDNVSADVLIGDRIP